MVPHFYHRQHNRNLQDPLQQESLHHPHDAAENAWMTTLAIWSLVALGFIALLSFGW